VTLSNPDQPTRIPSLDGLRAISVAFVILGHLAGTTHFPQSLYPLKYFAEFGVRVFFVLSGFLITTLLLKELELTGSISLKGFYLRRVFRIFPAAYSFIGAMTILGVMNIVYLNWSDVIHAVTYTVNYRSDRGWYLGHLWSLSVEEQFYLFWPVILKLTGRQKGLLLGITVCLICPIIRMVEFAYFPAGRMGVGERFETVADCIAIGCILAASRGWLSSQKWYVALMRSRLFFIVPLLTLSLNLPMRLRYEYSVAETLKNIGIALCIDWCIRFQSHATTRFLSARPMAFIGTLSYSLYLWQQPFINRKNPSVVTHFPINCVLAFGAALASYYLIEKPVLKIKKRFESSRVKGATARDLRTAL
jgi:peptidoglycan/LPS O-acetylase OafA/YrhL